MMASNARGGWVEMNSENPGTPEVKASKKITLKEIKEIKTTSGYHSRGQYETSNPISSKNTRKLKSFRSNPTRFRCLLSVSYHFE